MSRIRQDDTFNGFSTIAHLRLWRHAPTQPSGDDAKTDPAIQLLQTIPGVGPRTAEVVVAHLADPKRFAKGKQVSTFAGLVPRQFQSGERLTRRTAATE